MKKILIVGILCSFILMCGSVASAKAAKNTKNTKTAKTAQITQPAKTSTAIPNNPSKNSDESQITESVYSAKSGLKPADFRKLFNHLRPEFAKIPDLLPMTEGKPNFVKKNAILSTGQGRLPP